MPRPVPTTPFQEELYASMAPLMDQDASHNYDGLIFTGGIAVMFDQVELYARDDRSVPNKPRPGWAIIMDPDRIPDAELPNVLPWLGQFVGVDYEASLSLAEQRASVKNSGAFNRGTTQDMISKLQKTLTGTKTVFVKERDSSVSAVAGGAYGMTMLSLTTETPDSAKSLAAAKASKPAGIILAYNTVSGMTWQVVNTSYASWNAVKAAFLTWNGVRNNAPGT